MQLTIVCPTDNEEVLEANLLKSKAIKTKQCPVLLFKDPKNVMAALNEGKMATKTTHIAFIHQDVLLPDSCYDSVMESLTRITQIDSNFGALGVAGMYGDKQVGHVKNRGKSWGTPIGLPRVVETLDELLLITRKDNVWFDESIPSRFPTAPTTKPANPAIFATFIPPGNAAAAPTSPVAAVSNTNFDTDLESGKRLYKLLYRPLIVT